eukprot:SAG22_NODE_561_length_9080_cov_2.242623_3_plen_1054_part_00
MAGMSNRDTLFSSNSGGMHGGVTPVDLGPGSSQVGGSSPDGSTSDEPMPSQTSQGSQLASGSPAADSQLTQYTQDDSQMTQDDASGTGDMPRAAEEDDIGGLPAAAEEDGISPAATADRGGDYHGGAAVDNWKYAMLDSSNSCMATTAGKNGPLCPHPDDVYEPMSYHNQGKKTSQVYGADRFRQLTSKHPLFEHKFTFQCCAVLPSGLICNHAMKVAMTRGKRNTDKLKATKTSHMSGHLMQTHGISVSSKRGAAAMVGANNLMAAAGNLTSPKRQRNSGSFGPAVGTVPTAEIQKASQALWYIYEPGQVSKRTFRSPFFITMMKTAGAKEIVSVNDLKRWVAIEFQIFLILLSLIFEENWDYCSGNEFSQLLLLHDGGTLKNSGKYIAVVMQFVHCGKNYPNLHVCVGFPKEFEAVRRLIAEEMNKGDIEDDAFYRLTLQSASKKSAAVIARCVESALGVENWDDCWVRDDDDERVFVAVTDIVNSTEHRPGLCCARSEPGPVGRLDVIRRWERDVCHAPEQQSFFECSRRPCTDQKQEASQPHVKGRTGNHDRAPQVRSAPFLRRGTDHCIREIAGIPQRAEVQARAGTRVEAVYRQVNKNVRMPKSMMQTIADTKELAGLKQIVDTHGAANFLQSSIEFEAILNAVHSTTIVAQMEANYTGAYRVVNDYCLEKKLHAEHLDVVALSKVTATVGATGPLPRCSKAVSDFTPEGKECLERAKLEQKSRHETQMRGDRELATAFLDLRTRTLITSLFTPKQQRTAYIFLKQMYIHHGVACDEYEDRRIARLKLASQATGAVEQAGGAGAGAGGGGSDAAAQTTARTESTTADLSFGAMKIGDDFSENFFTQLDRNLVVPEGATSSGTGAEQEDEKDAEMILEERQKKYEAEFNVVFPKWLKFQVDWKEEFQTELTAQQMEKASLDVQDDLIHLNMGPFYEKLVQNPVLDGAGNPQFGHMPMLARAHIGQDQSESVCERVLSTANDVMTTGNTLLDDLELRRIVILRFNRKFMFEYREVYKDKILQRLKAIEQDPSKLAQFAMAVSAKDPSFM